MSIIIITIINLKLRGRLFLRRYPPCMERTKSLQGSIRSKKINKPMTRMCLLDQLPIRLPSAQGISSRKEATSSRVCSIKRRRMTLLLLLDDDEAQHLVFSTFTVR